MKRAKNQEDREKEEPTNVDEDLDSRAYMATGETDPSLLLHASLPLHRKANFGKRIVIGMSVG